jgi:hypothetical protein
LRTSDTQFFRKIRTGVARDRTPQSSGAVAAGVCSVLRGDAQAAAAAPGLQSSPQARPKLIFLFGKKARWNGSRPSRQSRRSMGGVLHRERRAAFGRWPRRAVRSRVWSRLATSRSAQCLCPAAGTDHGAQHPDHIQDLSHAPLIEGVDLNAHPDEGRDADRRRQGRGPARVRVNGPGLARLGARSIVTSGARALVQLVARHPRSSRRTR